MDTACTENERERERRGEGECHKKDNYFLNKYTVIHAAFQKACLTNENCFIGKMYKLGYLLKNIYFLIFAAVHKFINGTCIIKNQFKYIYFFHLVHVLQYMEIFAPFYFRPFRPRCQRANLRLGEFKCLKISQSL